MSRSRLVVFASALVVLVGSLTAVGALYLDPARAAVGPLPAEGLILPADAKFVMGIDVRRFVASPFYKKFHAEGHASRLQAFSELEEKTGLNPERDIDAIYVAGRDAERGGKGGHPSGVVLVVGTFDRYKISRAIETSHKGVTTKNHAGVPVYVFDEAQGTRRAGAVAFLDDKTLIMGSQVAVEQALSARAKGDGGLRKNTALTALLEEVRPGSAFWMVGDQSVLANMPGGAGAGPGGMTLPQLKSVMVTGEFEPVVAVDVTGEALDEAAAKNLADVVRGFVALASLQAAQKPELKQLASAVSVTTEENKVRVSARFPYEMIDALHNRSRKAASAAPATN